MVKRELSIRTFISRLGSALQEENEMRVSLAFIAAIMIARLALPVQAAAPVRGAVHGTATVGKAPAKPDVALSEAPIPSLGQLAEAFAAS